MASRPAPGFAGFEPIDFGGPKPARRVAGPAGGGGVGGGPALVVLYDRDCGICTASARQLRRWDRRGRLELLPLQDAIGPGTDRPDVAEAVAGRPLLAALHVYDEATGAIHAGGDAALAIGTALPGGRVVRALAVLPPFRWAVGLGYRMIARHRRRIGRWLRLEGPTCDVPR
jgi:predicted DCC family thiol-disulfide oxidoreductase YuxK